MPRRPRAAAPRSRPRRRAARHQRQPPVQRPHLQRPPRSTPSCRPSGHRGDPGPQRRAVGGHRAPRPRWRPAPYDWAFDDQIAGRWPPPASPGCRSSTTRRRGPSRSPAGPLAAALGRRLRRLRRRIRRPLRVRRGFCARIPPHPGCRWARSRSGTSPTTANSGRPRPTRPATPPLSGRRGAIDAVDPAPGDRRRPHHPAGFLPAILQAAPPAGHVDGVAIHPYGAAAGGPRARARRPGHLVALGLGAVPLYVTEFGWTTYRRARSATRPRAGARANRRRARGARAPGVRAGRHRPVHLGHARARPGRQAGLVRDPNPPTRAAAPRTRRFADGLRAAVSPGEPATLLNSDDGEPRHRLQLVADEPLLRHCSSAKTPLRNAARAWFTVTFRFSGSASSPAKVEGLCEFRVLLLAHPGVVVEAGQPQWEAIRPGDQRKQRRDVARLTGLAWCRSRTCFWSGRAPTASSPRWP